MRERWFSRRRELVQAIGNVIAAGQEAGQICPDIPSAVLGDYLLGMLRTRARDLREAPVLFRSDAFIVQLFCNAAGGSFKGISPEGRKLCKARVKPVRKESIRRRRKGEIK